MEQKIRVLIGYDGSGVAERVIDDLKWSGLPKQALVTVLSAADVFPVVSPDETTPPQLRAAIEKSCRKSQDALRVAQALSEHGATQIKKLFPEWTIYPESCADSPAWALIKKADDWKADLIVVGAHGHSPIGRFIGSVSQMVLVHATQTVRISRARPNSASDRLRILIGVDGSKDSQLAIETVAKRTWASPIEVFLMSVIEPKMSAMMRQITPAEIQWVLEQADDERKALGHILESYAKKLREKGAIVTCRVETGDPKHVLIEQAENWRADSIFLGARGLGGLKRFLIGGVSATVSARAHCSVEIVR